MRVSMLRNMYKESKLESFLKISLHRKQETTVFNYFS